MKTSSSQWREVYLCVALTTMATLLMELALTRIFSVVFYYHFAFLAISIALFGLGAHPNMDAIVDAYIDDRWRPWLMSSWWRSSC